MRPVPPRNAKRKCFVCGAGPRGLREYSSRRDAGGVLRVMDWLCAEWLVPCHRRNSAFGRKARRGLPAAEKNRRTPDQLRHIERVRHARS
jgi:hypothetical protein